MARVPDVALEEMTAEQGRVYQEIGGARGGVVRGHGAIVGQRGVGRMRAVEQVVQAWGEHGRLRWRPPAVRCGAAPLVGLARASGRRVVPARPSRTLRGARGYSRVLATA